MGHDNDDKTSLIPLNLDQNPAPFPETGQDAKTKHQAQVDRIMRTFLSVLPSNYVALVNGPWYTLQFQAIAEQIASIQLTAQEIYKDGDFDFTRTEFLWQIIGALVFPEATERSGTPTIDGDVDYRAFLHRMVVLLLQGATPSTVEEGAGLLTEAEVDILERFLFSKQRDPNSAWDLDDQFTFDLFVENGGGTEFPAEDPFILQENVRLILEALKPAHTLYFYQHLFRDAFGDIFTDDTGWGPGGDESGHFWTLSAYYYDDLRKFCQGARDIRGTSGATLTDRTCFSDPTVSFEAIQAGAVLEITGGANDGQHQVVDVRTFVFGDDATPRAYTTSPTGLTGSATVSGSDITDGSQNWALAVENEILTFTAGLNAGSYRLETLLGPDGGRLGDINVTGPATSVRVSPSILKVQRRMPSTLTGQTYQVTVDRMGVKFPRIVTGEDASEQFYV